MRAFLLPFLIVACSGAGDQAAEQSRNHHLKAALREPGQDDRCAGEMGSFHPEGGLIANASFAEEVARNYLRSLYPETFRQERHMKVELKNGVWFARTLLPEGWIGGSEYIEICRSNGRVLNYYATQ